MKVILPELGGRYICTSVEEGHYLWLDAFGWHDCSPSEDISIRAQILDQFLNAGEYD